MLLTFGKEYELSAYLNFTLVGLRNKTDDGSGPSEISTPPFTSPLKAVLWEALLYRIYGNSLFEYYLRGEERCDELESTGEEVCFYEEKGNHFHISISVMQDGELNENEETRKFLYKRFYVYATVFLLVRKLLTVYYKFRDSVIYWCEYFVPPNSFVYEVIFEQSHGREYAFFTPNRNRKNVLTLELRASEGSIALDVSALLIAEGIYLLIENEYSHVDLEAFKDYARLVDRLSIHRRLIVDKPTEVSLYVKIDEYLQSREYNAIKNIFASMGIDVEDSENTKVHKIAEIALKGLKKYCIFENAKELIDYLELFANEIRQYSRENFVHYMYDKAFEVFKSKLLEIWTEFGMFYEIIPASAKEKTLAITPVA